MNLPITLVQVVSKLANQLTKSTAQTPVQQATAKPTRATPARLAIALLLEQPSLAQALPDITILSHLELPGINLLNELLVICLNNPHINSAQIVEHYRDTEQGKQLAKLLCWEHQIESENAEDVFLDSIENLLNTFVEQRTEMLLQKARMDK